MKPEDVAHLAVAIWGETIRQHGAQAASYQRNVPEAFHPRGYLTQAVELLDGATEEIAAFYEGRARQRARRLKERGEGGGQ